MSQAKTTNGDSTKNDSSRSQAIIRSGYLFIAVNFLLGIINIVVGALSSSLAIT